jgi:hypothetical protein
MDAESAAKLFELIKRRAGAASLEQADIGPATNKRKILLRKVFLKANLPKRCPKCFPQFHFAISQKER